MIIETNILHMFIFQVESKNWPEAPEKKQCGVDAIIIQSYEYFFPREKTLRASL